MTAPTLDALRELTQVLAEHEDCIRLERQHAYTVADNRRVDAELDTFRRAQVTLAALLVEREANLAQAIADLLAERAAKTIIGQSYESERTAREAAEAERDVLSDVLLRAGFVRCDEPACMCGSWHHRYGIAQRFREIHDALREADVLDNSTGNLALNAIHKLTAQRDELQAAIERVRGCLEEIVTGGWLDDGSRESNAMRAKAADILRAVGEGEK